MNGFEKSRGPLCDSPGPAVRGNRPYGPVIQHPCIKSYVEMKTDVLSILTTAWSHISVIQVVKLCRIYKSWSILTSVSTFGMVISILSSHIAPSSNLSLLGLGSMHLLSLAAMGSQSNHVLVASTVDVAIILAYHPTREKWRKRFAASMFCILVLLYVLPALHKVNSDFFDPQVSCASHFLSGFLAMLLPLPTSDVIAALINSAPYQAIALESLLPLLLLFSQVARPRSCNAAMKVFFILGSTFHLFLCLPLPPMSVYPFSMVMVPFYIVSLPEDAASIVHHLFVEHWKTLLLLIAILTVVLSAALQRILDGGSMPLEYPAYGLWPVAVVWNICAWTMLAIVSVRVPSIPRVDVSITTRGSAVLVLVFSAVGLSPYMCIRNYPALAMFSNLRSSGEGRRSNHFLLREDLRIGHVWGNKDSFVTIHNTTLPALRFGQVNLANYYLPSILKFNDAYGVKNEFWINPPAWSPAGGDEDRPFVEYSLPYIEFHRRIRMAQGRVGTEAAFTIEFSLDGHPETKQLVTIQDENDSRHFLPHGPPGVIESSIFRFRSFDIHYSPCRH